MNTENGLSQNCVTSICQDAENFLWFGTNDGLNCFDGYNFKIYRTDYQDTNTLSDNHIRKIVSDRENNLWILTTAGLNRMDRRTETIRRYRINIGEKIHELYQTSGGESLFLSAHRIFRYSSTGDSLQDISPVPLQHTLTIMAEDRKGTLYAGTREGDILIYGPNLKPIRQIRYRPADSRNPGTVSHICVDGQDRIWIIFGNEIIGRLDSAGNQFVPVPTQNCDIIDKDIRAVIDLDADNLLLGTFNGLFLLNKNTLHVVPGSTNTGEKGELNHFSIYSLYCDRQGTLWVGTNAGGINYHNIYNNRFEFIQPQQFSGTIGMGREDSSGTIWFATEGGGLLSYDPKTGTQHNHLLNTQNRAYNDNIIKAIYIGGDTIWCTTHRGEIYLFSIKKQTYSLLKDFGYNNIVSIFKDSQGSIWAATNTNKGLIAIRNGQDTNRFLVNGGKRGFSTITVISESAPGMLLLGSQRDGFYQYNTNTGELVHITASDLGLPPDSRIGVTAFHCDSEKNIWVATDEAGFFILDKKLRLKKHYLQNSPGPGEKIYFITEDSSARIWVMTNRQLFRFNPQTEKFRCFDAHNGMVSQDFSLYSGFLSREGCLYLSGNKGIIRANTRRFPMNTSVPSVLLTTLRINNKEIQPGTEDSPLQQQLRYTSGLTLKHNETNITIGYTAINYIYPQRNQYAYRLEGIDQEWVVAGNRREAIYSNLPPGNYTFRVRAYNNDGIENSEGAMIQIRVLPPLWQRWWAYLIYTLLIGAVVRQYVIYRQRKQTLENELRFRQLEQERAEEVHQERLRFFTHIAHEFRTPLTLIVNPLDELSEKTVHISGARDSLSMIRKNTLRLLSLVNNLLNIQKLESGKGQLHPSTFDFHEFMQEICYTFQTMAQSRKISFSLDMDDRTLLVNYDRDELEKVFFNLLSNAFKFTPQDGIVTLSVSFCDRSALSVNLPDTATRWLQIEVKDNGIGISEENRHKLFEPFSVSGEDLHGRTTGSGIGLSISRSIVEQHHGLIYLRESSSRGSVLCVLLPYYIPAGMPDDTLPGIEPEEQPSVITSPPPAVPLIHTLLIADDNGEVLGYLCRQLEKEYKIRTATNGREALRIVREETIDLIVSDVMMPEMDGIELCKEIKANDILRHIPIILLTAKAMTLHIEEGFNAGADDYLIKPFKISALKARIKNILTERERLKEIYSRKISLKSVGIEVEAVDKTFMENYIAIVKQNISNPDFDIDMLCRELGMSRANFYRKVKAVTTLSPAEMIRNIRLECAAELLKTSHLTASEVSFQVGFGSYTHFSSYFRAAYGISPKEFKEKGDIQ